MIHLECKPDVALLKKLTGLGRKGINHAGSKSEVVKGVEKENKALGLVDQDPFAIQPKAMNNYQPYRSLDQAEIKVLKRGDKFLIILCPRLEEWIIKAAREVVEIDIKNYGLSQSGEKLGMFQIS